MRTFLQFARMFYYMAEFRGLHYLFDIPFATWQPIFAYCTRLSTRLIFPYQPFSNSRLTAITYGAVACFQDGIPMWLGTRHEAVKHDFFSLLHWGSKILKNSGFFFFFCLQNSLASISLSGAAELKFQIVISVQCKCMKRTFGCPSKGYSIFTCGKLAWREWFMPLLYILLVVSKHVPLTFLEAFIESFLKAHGGTCNVPVVKNIITQHPTWTVPIVSWIISLVLRNVLSVHGQGRKKLWLPFENYLG